MGHVPRVQVGMGGAAVCYSYSCSKGAFAGVSIEGSLLTTRSDVNLNFYGKPSALRFGLCWAVSD